MSFNGSGTYVPPAGQPVAAGTVIQSSTFNTLVTDIGNTFNNVLPRDGQAAMSAPFKLIDGTSSVPGIAFNSEAATGIYRPTTGIMAFVASGVEALRLNSSGRVLIGTTADDGVNRLQVNGPVQVTGALGVTGAVNVSGVLTAASHNGPLTGNVTGNLTGNVSGTLTGNVNGNVTGNVSGTLTGNVNGNVTGNVSGTAANVTGVVALANGGTGATTAVAALTNLGAAPIANPTFTGTVTGNVSGTLTGNVTGNVSGTAANVTGVVALANGGTGATTAIGALTNLGAAPIASPTFTGTVNGVTATMVGLGNVTNTSDANKPVSTAQQAALNLKANIAAPSFTGNSTFGAGAAMSYTNYTTVLVQGAQGAVLDLGSTAVGVGGNRVAQLTAAVATGLTFATGASDTLLERMRLSPAGNLLIGTSTDNGADKLQVNGGTSGSLNLQNVYSFGSANYSLKITGDAGTAGGYLGQNPASGGFMLSQGGVYYGGGLSKTDANSTSFASIAGNGGALTFTTNGGLTASTTFNSSERMRLAPTGNLLIGHTRDSGFRLSVLGSLTPYTAAGMSLFCGNGAGAIGTNGPRADISVQLVNNWRTNLIFSVNTSDTDSAPVEVGRFDASGNLAIGTTSAYSKLDMGTSTFYSGTPTTTGQLACNVALFQSGNTSHYGFGVSTAALNIVAGEAGGTLRFHTGGANERMRITAAGVIQDAAGNELGYKDAVQNIIGGAYTLTTADRGKSVVMNAASSAVTVPNSVFPGGAVVTIYNNSGSAQTIVQASGLSMKYGVGASLATGNRTLANNGMCTVYFINSVAAAISGNGVT